MVTLSHGGINACQIDHQTSLDMQVSASYGYQLKPLR